MIGTSEDDDMELVGPVEVVRISPGGYRLARTIPGPFIRASTAGPRTWIAVCFVAGVGLTAELLTDEQVADWTVINTADTDRTTT